MRFTNSVDRNLAKIAMVRFRTMRLRDYGLLKVHMASDQVAGWAVAKLAGALLRPIKNSQRSAAVGLLSRTKAT